MEFSAEQIERLKNSFPEKEVKVATEGGLPYVLISQMGLPEGCNPSIADLLYCGGPRDGYPSRLFFSATISGGRGLPWNTTTVILGKTWYAYSWRIDTVQDPAQSILTHLRALR
jgi:hypothetical protein